MEHINFTYKFGNYDTELTCFIPVHHPTIAIFGCTTSIPLYAVATAIFG